MYQILSIRVDGYRNISNTIVRLAEPITVLLAPNNYGKTNFLLAIEFAVDLIGHGPERQSEIIKANKYTSHNKISAPENKKEKPPFLFEIEFVADGKNITYAFQILPSAGVLTESLMVGDIVIFERNRKTDLMGEKYETIEMNDANASIGLHNLLISQLSDRNIEATEYADVIRKLFNSMRNMFCNRESPLGNYKNDEKRNLVNISDRILKLFNKDKNLYFKFKNVFLGLFKGQIENFIMYDVRDRSKVVFPEFPIGYESNELEIDFESPEYRPEDYRIEFNSYGKLIPELFTDLSTGTQDIFLVFLEIFDKYRKPILVIEEIENGIHPSLYQNVLSALYKECDEKRALITTHSPAVARHFTSSFASFYIGIPNRNGFASFAALDEYKKDEIARTAKLHSVSMGELIIDMLSESDRSSEKLKGWLRGH